MVCVRQSPILRRVFLNFFVLLILTAAGFSGVFATEANGAADCIGSTGFSDDTACAQPGALQPKVMIKPASTTSTSNTTPIPEIAPGRDVVAPVTTTPAQVPVIQPKVTLRVVTPTTAVPTTTPVPATTLISVRQPTPEKIIAPQTTVTTTSTTSCRDCGTTPTTAAAKNFSAAGMAPASPMLSKHSPDKGVIDSIIGFFGSLLGMKEVTPPTKYNRWELFQSDLLDVSRAYSPAVTYKSAGDRFIEMESYDTWDVYGNDQKGMYTWNPGPLAQNNVTSAFWQVSLYPFPSDKKIWWNPPGLLGYGDAGTSVREFTVDFSAFLPPISDVDAHWEQKTPMLQFKKSEIEQIEAQLAAQQPFDPGAPQSPADQIMLEQLESSRQAVQTQLNNPSLQGYQPKYQTGTSAYRALPPPNGTQSDSIINPAVLRSRMTALKEALYLTLPSDQRIVYVRVVTLDATGNATGLSNSLPVVVGKKQVNLISPWSDWQVLSPANGQSAGPLHVSGAYFNKKIYLFGSGGSGNKVLTATLDAGNVFSGWSELPGAPASNRPISAVAVQDVENDDPLYLYIALLPSDGSGRVKYTRMDRQGGWAGWKEVPGDVRTEVTPYLTSWVRNSDKGLVLTIQERTTNKNKFTAIRWIVRGTPSFPDETWEPWQEVPAGPVASVPPVGSGFSYDRPETPQYSPDFKRGYVFIGRSMTNSGSFKANHLYSTTNSLVLKESGNWVWQWADWTEIPGDKTSVSNPSVVSWNDRIYVSVTSNTGNVSIADFDALGEWNNWTAHPYTPPSVGSPVLVSGETLRLIKEGAGDVGNNKLIVSSLSGAQFLVSEGLTAPATWMYCSSGDVEQPDCARYYSTGGVFIPHPSGMTGSWAGDQPGAIRVIWQVSRIPFNITQSGEAPQTLNDIMMHTPGVVASGLRETGTEKQINGKPPFIPPVHPFSMNTHVFSPNPNERITYYARAIILTTSDIPGELNGYVTPTTKFIYGARPMPKVCPMPEEHKVVVPVPDVKIREYHPYFPGNEPGCHVISTKAWSLEMSGVEASPCPTIGSTMYVCEEPSWWDKVCDFFSSMIEFFASVVNFVSRAWDVIKSTCVDLVANVVPFCDDKCKFAISGAIDVGLASIGVPPQIPNFSDLQNMGADYLAAKIAEEAGVPKEVARAGIDALNSASEEVRTTGDVCGWKPNPAYEPRPAYINVSLKNYKQVNTTPGNLMVKTPVVGPGSGEYRNRNLYDTNTQYIPYPSLQPGQELIIPIFLSPSISTNDGSDGGIPPEMWNNAASNPYLRLEVHADPRRSIDIAALEEELGMEYVDMTSYTPRLSYGECPQKEFYVTYVLSGSIWDKVQPFRPYQAYP